MSVERAKITKQFSYVHTNRSITEYPAGYEGPMPAAQYERAKALGYIEGEKPSVDPKTATAAELEKSYSKDELNDIATAAEITDLSGTKLQIAERIVAARS
jgi:hypothetical protein